MTTSSVCAVSPGAKSTVETGDRAKSAPPSADRSTVANKTATEASAAPWRTTETLSTAPAPAASVSPVTSVAPATSRPYRVGGVYEGCSAQAWLAGTVKNVVDCWPPIWLLTLITAPGSPVHCTYTGNAPWPVLV